MKLNSHKLGLSTDTPFLVEASDYYQFGVLDYIFNDNSDKLWSHYEVGMKGRDYVAVFYTNDMMSREELSEMIDELKKEYSND